VQNADRAAVIDSFRKVLTLAEPVEVVVNSKMEDTDILEMVKNISSSPSISRVKTKSTLSYMDIANELDKVEHSNTYLTFMMADSEEPGMFKIIELMKIHFENSMMLQEMYQCD